MTTAFPESSVIDMEATAPIIDFAMDGNDIPHKKIVFVCTGNTCRSPMAEVVFNYDYADSGYIAESAGLMADGSPMSENSLDALFEDGYRVKGRKSSRMLTNDILEMADIVVGISSSHAMQIIMNHPEYAEKIYCMPFDITDPYGGSLETYKACLADIKKALAIVAESL